MCLICTEITKFQTINEVIQHYLKHPEDVLVRFGMSKLFLLRQNAETGVEQLARYAQNTDMKTRQSVTDAILRTSILPITNAANQRPSHVVSSFMQALYGGQVM